MCPLRIILIFLSAALAGFFVLRNVNAPLNDDASEETADSPAADADSAAVPLCSKVGCAVGKGFWTFVDMASGKYLWKNLVSSSSCPAMKQNKTQ